MRQKTSLESLEELTAAVEAAGADIAPRYEEFVRMAMGIATDCGEAGRPYFHRLCRLYSNYKSDATDRVYTGVMKSGRGEIHLGTVFYYAAAAGVEVKEKYDEWKRKTEEEGGASTAGFPPVQPAGNDNDRDGAPTDPRVPLPLFPVYRWPAPIGETLAVADRREQRDVLLIGAFTVIGATMGGHVRTLYGRKWLYPSLQTFIIAPAASGKGILSFLRAFGTTRHRELREEYEREMNEYMAAVRARRGMTDMDAGAEMPKKPKNRMFFIAGNNTGTGILQNLIDSDGEGLIFEPEADTVSSAIKGDYGHWSDTLRKAFDHDPLSFNRRTDNEYRETASTKLAVLLSGTPAQVARLIPSAENGLFSRQLFYYMPSADEWINQFSPIGENPQALFDALGEKWGEKARTIRKSTFTLNLTEEQQREFTDFFAHMLKYTTASTSNEMSSTVMRLAVNLVRMMSVTAMLRAVGGETDILIENDGLFPYPVPLYNLSTEKYILTLTDDDFHAVIDLAEPLKAHATHVLSLLPQPVVKRRSLSDKAALLDSMPDCFTRQLFTDEARRRGIEGAHDSYLSRLVKKGIIKKTGKWGEYIKILDKYTPSIHKPSDYNTTNTPNARDNGTQDAVGNGAQDEHNDWTQDEHDTRDCPF